MSVILESQDGKRFTVAREIVMYSRTLADLLDDLPEGEVLHVLTVSGALLERIIFFIQRHVELERAGASEGEVGEFNAQFIELPDEILFKLILAANFLDIKPLLDLACQHVAKFVEQCKTPEELRLRFNIINDFDPSEEQDLARRHNWLYDEHNN